MNQMTFKALFEHSSLGIIISNKSGIIEKSNPYASKIFGYNQAELVGKEVEILIPPALKEKHIHYRDLYNQNPQPRTMGSNANLMAVRKNGDQFPVEVSLTFFETDGQLQIVSFINDITDRKKAENALLKLTESLESKVKERTKELSDALTELGHTNEGLHLEMEQRKKVEAQIRDLLENEKIMNELKSRFVSMASHEFRTPLGGILTSASLISKYPNTEDEPKREKHIQNIKKSVKNLTSILNDFLSLDKLEQGKVASNPAHFDFIFFIQEMIEELSETTEKKHSIIIDHKDREIFLYQDKEMIRNVVINLVSNAIKYSPENSVIYFRTQVQDTLLIIEIQDSGMGIPKEDKNIFLNDFFGQKMSPIFKALDWDLIL